MEQTRYLSQWVIALNIRLFTHIQIVALTATLSAKRQRKVVDATKTVSSLRDGMETMKSETQIQLDDAQLSVDALTADNVNLKNQVKQLQHDCADAVEELEVSIFFITIFISD